MARQTEIATKDLKTKKGENKICRKREKKGKRISSIGKLGICFISQTVKIEKHRGKTPLQTQRQKEREQNGQREGEKGNLAKLEKKGYVLTTDSRTQNYRDKKDGHPHYRQI